MVALTGCLPQDHIRELRFSPDSRQIAYISDKKGLCMVNPDAGTAHVLARGDIQGNWLDWLPAGNSVAFVSSRNGNWDISLAGVDGQTTRITSDIARQSYPFFGEEAALYCLDAASGKDELLRIGETSATLTMQHDIVSPAISADRRHLAFYSCVGLRPQIFALDLQTSRVDRLTSESNSLALDFAPLQWSRSGDKLISLRNNERSFRGPVRKSGALDAAREPARILPREVRMIERTGGETRETLVVSSDQPVSWVNFSMSGEGITYIEGERLKFASKAKRKAPLDLNDLAPSIVQTSPDGSRTAVVVEDQLIALYETTSTRPRILTFDLQDKFLLAEAYFRRGATSRSYALYEELAKSVQRTQDPALARFVYAANLQRLGRTRDAMRAIESILDQPELPPSVPRQYLWRALAFSHLLYLDEPGKSREYFGRYRQAVNKSPRINGAAADTAVNALLILERDDERLTRKFAAAVRARLEGRVEQTIKLWGQLLAMAPEFAPIQQEYLRALEGFDEDVYYFSPSQRPFNPGHSLRAKHLERFLKLTPESPLADSARLKLFLVFVESERFGSARSLLETELRSTDADSESVEGIFEVFGNYLETAELQPWLEAAMAEVFLHPDIRTRLVQRIEDVRTKFLVHLAAAKLALVQGRNDAAREELDGSLAQWQQMDPALQTYTTKRFYARLICMRAMEAETRNLLAEATGYYQQALQHLENTGADEFELYAEIRYRSEFLRYCIAHAAHMATEQFAIEKSSGDELVNPTWDISKLASAVVRHVQLYDAAAAAGNVAQRSINACEAGVLFGKLGRSWQARAAFREAMLEGAPAFVRQKAQLELAHLDEDLSDPYNAVRLLDRAAAELPEADYLQPWLKYNTARLNLGINTDRKLAREALAQLVNTRPGTPLSVQAQELLATTAD